jgi:tyrosyl-tRNA synthetase
MWRWFDLLSFKSSREIELLKVEQANGMNPRDIKISLAKELIARFHDDQAADQAEKNFIDQFQKKNIPEQIEELTLSWREESILLPNLLKEASMTKSTSEAMRMIKQGAVRIDEEKVIDPKHSIIKGSTAIYQVGKRKFKKITL